MKRFGLQISLLALLVMPAIFVFGWWARDRSYGQTIARLERSIARLTTQRKNDLLLDELRGEWIETSNHDSGVLIDYGDVEVEWLLIPAGESQRTIMYGELETHPLGQFAVDATRVPAWIDFQGRGGGRRLGIVRLSHGYTDFGTAIIALSPASGDGRPVRPTSFKSTRENGVSVYRLKRAY